MAKSKDYEENPWHEMLNNEDNDKSIIDSLEGENGLDETQMQKLIDAVKNMSIEEIEDGDDQSNREKKQRNIDRKEMFIAAIKTVAA